MEHEGLDTEAARLRFRHLVLDHVQIAVVDVHATALDRQPGPSVEDAAAPRADLADLTLPADGAEIGRVEGAAVVDRQVPVAVGPFGALGPGAAEGDGLDGGEQGETVCDGVEEGGHSAAPGRTDGEVSGSVKGRLDRRETKYGCARAPGLA